MGRGRAFSPIEEDLLRDNYDKTIAELEELLARQGYERSRKSINRKLEKMREEGAIGFRSRDTVRRSYRQRTRRSKKLEPTKIGTGNSFDTGASGFDVVTNWDETGFE